MNPTPERYKVVMFGPISVGKSCLVTALQDKKFNKYVDSTIGATFYRHNQSNGVTLDIWDTAGQERYNAYTPLFLRGADAIICCCVYRNKESFETLQQKIQNNITEEMRKQSIIVYCATKTDLVKDDKDDKRTWKSFDTAEECDICVCTSSFTGEGVQEMFVQIADMCIKNRKDRKNQECEQPIIYLSFETPRMFSCRGCF